MVPVATAVGEVRGDEGVRRGATLEKLASLPTLFVDSGEISAGNSSQISDGAAAVLITTSERAAALGLTPLVRIHSAVVAGEDPVKMLTGPIPATQLALKRSGLWSTTHWAGRSGINTPRVDLCDEDVPELFRTGLLGTLYLMQAAFAALCDSDHAVVINLRSAIGVRGGSRQAAYSMAKEAIGGVTKSAAMEWGKYGIRANLVCPRPGHPEQSLLRPRPHALGASAGSIPLRRFGDPYGDIGRAIIALVSDDLHYLTGATIMLDGGLGDAAVSALARGNSVAVIGFTGGGWPRTCSSWELGYDLPLRRSGVRVGGLDGPPAGPVAQ